jgi:hypothetical protein
MGVANLEKGGGMKYHGVDPHKRCATISVRDEAGAEVKFLRAQADMSRYMESLGSQDAVVVEVSAGALAFVFPFSVAIL